MPLKLTTYYRGDEIPELPGNNTFHSKELFQTYEATPGYTPLLIVASQNGKPVAKLLAVSRKSVRFFPPSIIKRCEIYGTGEYIDDDIDTETIFGEILEHLTNEMMRHSFFIEFRNLENAKFAYKQFRQNNYFPINWLCVRNSLHHTPFPENRFSPSRLRQIKKGLKNGATIQEVESLDELRKFSQMLHNVYSAHIRKHFPNIEFFRHMDTLLIQNKQGKIFIIKHKDKIIGGSSCIYSENNAYLWFSGGMRKSYSSQSPGILAVWAALKDAHEQGFDHLEFMDVGLPFKRHGYREFVLQFGGKQSSTRRWFKFRWNWLNKLLASIYV